jgi:hypothetical protein
VKTGLVMKSSMLIEESCWFNQMNRDRRPTPSGREKQAKRSEHMARKKRLPGDCPWRMAERTLSAKKYIAASP